MEIFDDKLKDGFTLIELLLVMAIIGLLLALVVPRAQRARLGTKFSQVRQCGTEIASTIMTWAEDRARNQYGGISFTVKDFIYSDIELLDPAYTSSKLSRKYTGNDAFDGVQSLVPVEQRPKNPFNMIDYYASVNDDKIVEEDIDAYGEYQLPVPSVKPGLLYLAVQSDPTLKEYLNFYLLYTATVAVDAEQGAWFGEMDNEKYTGLRHGVFVARLFDDQEDGSRNENLFEWHNRQLSE